MASFFRSLLGGSAEPEAEEAGGGAADGAPAGLSPDEVRRRRLARFADAAASDSASPAPASPASPAPPASPSSPSSPEPSVPSPARPRPQPAGAAVGSNVPGHATSAPSSAERNAPSRSGTPDTAAAADPPRTPSAPSNVPARSPSTPAASSPSGSASPTSIGKSANSADVFGKWMHATIAEVFQVTLQANHSSYVQLPDIASELAGDGAPPMFTDKMLDQIIVERFSLETAAMSNLTWLVDSFERNDRQLRRCKNEQRAEVCKNISTVLISYGALVLQDASMFSTVFSSDDHIKRFVHLLSSYDSNLSIDFVDGIVAQCQDDSFDSVFMPMFNTIRDNVSHLELCDSFSPPLRAMATLVKYPKLASQLCENETWLRPDSEKNGRMVEDKSFLGPFFSFSCFPEKPAVAQQLYSDTTSASAVSLSDSHVSSSLSVLHTLLHEILFSFVKAGRREALLQWVAQAVESNAFRAKMQPDPTRTSSDGFMQNLGAVMAKFCEPFLDPQSPKVKLIDMSYLGSSVRFSVKDDTKLVATENEVAAWVDRRNQNCIDRWLQKQKELGKTATRAQAEVSAKQSYGFVTELFFLSMRCFHVGLIASFGRYEQYISRMRELRDSIDRANERRSHWENTPFAARTLAALEEREEELEFMKRQRFSLLGQLFESSSLRLFARYYSLVESWLLSVADPEMKGPPFSPPDMSFRSLPEHVVEDIATFWNTIGRYHRDYVALVREGDYGVRLLRFVSVFIGTPAHIRNPYLRSKLSEIILMFKSGGHELMALLDTDPMVVQNLVPSILSLYVDVELTGSHTQFFDKFNIRHQLIAILKSLWELPGHRKAFVTESKNARKFTQFADHVLNDGTFLLDEALLKLEEIKGIETEKEDQATWNAQPPEVLRDREKHYDSLGKQVRSFLTLGNEVLEMLHFMTTRIVEPFMVPELVDRVAMMLDSYLSALSGPRSSALLVKDPQQYNWNPQILLEQISDLYRHLDHPEFCAAVSRDGRYYSHEVFESAARLLSEREWRSRDMIASFMAVAEKIKAAKSQDEMDEDALGEIPDEFLDPITCDLMRDPVKLPSSVVVDRPTIQRHLLSDPTDPFNRQPLKEEDLVSDVELKEKIDAFLRSKKGQ